MFHITTSFKLIVSLIGGMVLFGSYALGQTLTIGIQDEIDGELGIFSQDDGEVRIQNPLEGSRQTRLQFAIVNLDTKRTNVSVSITDASKKFTPGLYEEITGYGPGTEYGANISGMVSQTINGEYVEEFATNFCGDGIETVSGKFYIHEMEYDGEELVRAAFDIYLVCEGYADPIKASVRYNSSLKNACTSDKGCIFNWMSNGLESDMSNENNEIEEEEVETEQEHQYEMSKYGRMLIEYVQRKSSTITQERIMAQSLVDLLGKYEDRLRSNEKLALLRTIVLDITTHYDL